MDILRFLLNRPIAVGIIFLAGVLTSVLAWFHLPVSLLPELHVPYLTIAVSSPGRNPEDIERNFLRPLREGLLTLDDLKDVESSARNETGTITLHFRHGTNMSLTYVEVNEKIDRLIPSLPDGAERPLVMKASSSDIPVLHIQAIPEIESDMTNLSELARHVLKRRIEQIDGVGMVDMNGLSQKVVTLQINEEQLIGHNMTIEHITQTIRSANIDLGSISVRDGHYRYLLKIAPIIRSVDDLKQLPVLLPGGGHLLLHQLATVEPGIARKNGFHLFQGKPCVVLAVHKQPDARLPEVMPGLEQVVEQFRKDYPQIRFETSRDQSLLLTLSMENMYSALLWGGFFAFVVLFLFIGNWREPLLMGIVLPISLVLSFSLLYVLNVSINIVSLSGLALGMGMLVDNSIVIIDSIMLKRKEGLTLIDSCVYGTGEVAVPLMSSALTNMAVFVPLIFMGDMSGELFYDQAMSVGAILSASMVCTFVLVPLLYLILFRNRRRESGADSYLFTILKKWYHRSFLFIWKHKGVSLSLMLILIPSAFWQLYLLPKTALPDIERRETLLSIDWNEPISLGENADRVIAVASEAEAEISEVDGGFRQFIFGSEQYNAQQADVYLLFASAEHRQRMHDKLARWFRQTYPQARVEFRNAPDPFEQIFANRNPLLEIRFRDPQSGNLLPASKADSLLNELGRILEIEKGEGFEKENSVILEVDFEKLASFKVPYEALITELRRILDDYPITGLRSMSDYTPVVTRQPEEDFAGKLDGGFVRSATGSLFPLRLFISYRFAESYKAITADQAGIYQGVKVRNPDKAFEAEDEIVKTTKDFSLAASWQGQWFDNEKDFERLIFIMLISLLLMYFILTAEFESLRLPLVVLSSFPIGLAGSFFLLWISNGSINVMSGIGLVVVLGILDNDAILNIDRINTLRKTMPLEQAIQQAGLDRLKPIVMNTLTNVLVLTPIVFSSGLGADLQQPVSLAIIGGLIVATFTALYFIPLMYWLIERRRAKHTFPETESPEGEVIEDHKDHL